jgi:hypothetical protein
VVSASGWHLGLACQRVKDNGAIFHDRVCASFLMTEAILSQKRFGSADKNTETKA